MAWGGTAADRLLWRRGEEVTDVNQSQGANRTVIFWQLQTKKAARVCGGFMMLGMEIQICCILLLLVSLLQTPSLVPPHLIQRILSELTMKYGIAQGAEVSMEADPGTFDRSKLSQYLELGVTRVSLGVQAFQEVSMPVCLQHLECGTAVAFALLTPCVWCIPC
jgi:hypothetical protein